MPKILNQKGAAHLLLLSLLLIGIAGGVYLVTSSNTLKLFSRATNPPIVFKGKFNASLPLNASGIPVSSDPQIHVELTSTLGPAHIGIGSTASVSGPIKIFTASFRIAEDPATLSSQPWNAYTADPTTFPYALSSGLGQKFIWVEFKDNTGKTDRRSAAIEIGTLAAAVAPPSPILADDNQTGFWVLENGTYALGHPLNKTVTLSNDSSQKQSGDNSLKMSVSNGPYNVLAVKHEFLRGPEHKRQDWSMYNKLSFYWLGANTNTPLDISIQTGPENLPWLAQFRCTFIDNFTGWKKLDFEFKNCAKAGFPDASQVHRVFIMLVYSKALSSVPSVNWNIDRVELSNSTASPSPLPSPSTPTSIFGKALKITSADSYISTLFPGPLANIGAIALWIKPDFQSLPGINPTEPHVILGKESASGEISGFRLSVVNKKVEFIIAEKKAGGAVANRVITSDTELRPDQWYYIYISNIAGLLSMYINGVQQGSTVGFASIQDNKDRKLVIGCGKPVNFSCLSPFYGEIDEVLINFNKGVSAIPPTTPFTPTRDTLVLYHLDGNIKDANNRFDGQATGTLQFVSSTVGGKGI